MATKPTTSNARPGTHKRPKQRLTVAVVERALRANAGIMSVAAQKLGVDRSTVSRFVAKHDKLRLVIEEITDEMNDLAEGGLLLAIKDGKEWAIKFWLAQRGQARGYGQRKLAFRDQEGTIMVPGVMVGDGRMTEEDWAATDWANQNKPADATIQ